MQLYEIKIRSKKRNETKQNKNERNEKSYIFIIIVRYVYIVPYNWINVNFIENDETYSGAATCIGNVSAQRCRNIPSHNWTPMMPKMKKTKKHKSNTLPSIGNVSSNSITSIRIPFENFFVNIDGESDEDDEDDEHDEDDDAKVKVKSATPRRQSQDK